MAKLKTPEAEETKRGKRFADVAPKRERTDLPEWIKPVDLMRVPKFTITGARRNERGRFGPQINFDVAWPDSDGTVNRKVVSLDANDEREQIRILVQKEKFLTNVRLVKIRRETGSTYWLLMDADSPLPDDVTVDGLSVSPELSNVQDDDIPF